MKFKMIIKMMALILTLLMCISAFPVNAYIYSPGLQEYDLDINCLIESNDVNLSADNIVFSAGGTIKFDLLLPFISDSITFKYQAISENTEISIVTDEHIYTTTFVTDETTNKVEINELFGSNTITFSANKAVVITGITFGKLNENYHEKNSADIPLTEYEYATLTSVVFKDNATVLKARGAIQKLDIENICLTPMNIDGRLYVPFGKLAQALGYYCEDYPDKAYIYMTCETGSLAMIRGTGYVESDKDGRRDVSLDVTYKEGTTWVPVRKLAEVLGFTVQYKNGFVIIDDRLSAKKIVEDEHVFNELTDEFDPYILSEKIEGKIYHVSQSSTTQNPIGTENNPFKTIEQATIVAKAGDTVIIHEGTYREVLAPQNDGYPLAPITFRAAAGEKVVISALDKLSSFSHYKEKIYLTKVETDLGFGRNQLFYKGEALNQGRHPNSDTKIGVVSYPVGVPQGLYATKGNISIIKPNSDMAYSDTDLNQDEKNYWKGGTFVTLKGEGWNLVSGEITASTKGELTLKDHDGSKSYNLGLILPEGLTNKCFTKVYDTDYGYITNHLNTVDVEGEWFMDKNVMYIIPPEGANLEKDFEVKQRQLTIDLRGKKYITIDGIDTIGGGITMAGDSTEGCVLNNGEFRYIAHHTVLLDQSRYAMTADEQQNSLKSIKAGEAGICLDGKQNSIVNSVIEYSSAAGVYVLGKYHYINNNIIRNTVYSGASPGAITVSVDVSKGESAADEVFGGHFITYNTVSNASRSLISFSSKINDDVVLAASPVEVAYNRFYNGALTSRDTGLTYEYGFTGGNDKSKTRLHHNFVYNPGYKEDETGSTLAMIYHDGYSAARDTYCNVTYYEEKDKTPTDQVFIYSPQYTVIRERNNSELGYLANGENDFLRSDFPGGRWFEPGCDHDTYARSMRSYDNFKKGDMPYYPASVSSDKKTYTFENIELEARKYATMSLYMTRDVNVSGEFNVTAKLYNHTGSLVKEITTKSTAQTEKFYIYENHREMVVIPPIDDAGIYDVEIVFSDDTIDLQRVDVETFDAKYDNLYTEEMESSGMQAYLPVSVTESDGEQSITFENVYFESNVKKILDLHVLREFGQREDVLISAEMYDSGNNLVANVSLPNSFTHSQYSTYEALSGIVVIPELVQSGNYKVVVKLSDTHSHPLRLVAKEASSEYDNIFNESVILGGSYDEWIRNSAEGTDITRKANLTLDRIKNYNYYSVNGCYEPTVIYKNRVIKEDSTVLRFTYATEGSYVGSNVSLYVDSLDSEPIATWITDKDTRWKPETEYILLNRTLEAGTHTFYFKFSGGNGKCSNIYNFSFGTGGKQDVKLFADFENMPASIDYTAEQITEKTDIPMEFGNSYSSIYNISGKVVEETDGNNILKLLPTQEADVIKSMFTLSNALEIGKIEMGYEFEPDSNRPANSSWSMFYYENEAVAKERLIKFMDEWLIYDNKVNGTIYYAKPGKNSKGRYCFKSVISRYDVNDDWDVRILDMSGNSPKLFFKGTIHHSFGNIKNLYAFNLYTGSSGWPGIFDNYFINVYDFADCNFGDFVLNESTE